VAEADAHAPTVPAPEAAPPTPEPTDWVAVAVVLGTANLLLAAGGLLAYRWSGGRRRAAVSFEPSSATGGPG
jgi:hypothetical protein